jgi:hypothetical protein
MRSIALAGLLLVIHAAHTMLGVHGFEAIEQMILVWAQEER